jgi:iron complex transport system permease protein
MTRCLALPLGLLVAALFGLMAGHDWMGPARLWQALSGEPSLQSGLILHWRLPRVLAAGLVGALLGSGGAIFQGVFRNPLAEPYLLGTAGGGAVGATIALLLPTGLPPGLALAGLSFVGAWGATWAVLLVARLAGGFDTAALLLAGVSIAAILQAIRSGMMLALSDESVSLQVVLSWTLGGIQTPGWDGLALLAGLAALGLLVAQRLHRGLDLLGLGDEQANAFGLDTVRFTRLAVLAGALVVAIAVAWGGLVAFIGLVAPHLARWTVGPRHGALLPVSAAYGAMLVMLCDGVARAVLPPAEIPLGLITALVGGPFFLFVLARRARR